MTPQEQAVLRDALARVQKAEQERDTALASARTARISAKRAWTRYRGAVDQARHWHGRYLQATGQIG